MALKTDRKFDDIIDHTDINAIATETNRLTGRDTALSADVDGLKTRTTALEARPVDGGVTLGGPLDLRTLTPSFVTRLFPGRNNVIQNAVKDPVTGEWYVAQYDAADNPGKSETTFISRCTPAGVFIDMMTLTNAGHGSNTEIQRINNVVYVWCIFTTVDANGYTTQNNIARVKYSPGTKTKTHADVQIIPTFETSYHNASLDFDNDIAMIRVANTTAAPNNGERYVKRRISDMLNNVNIVLSTINPIYTNTTRSPPGSTSQGYGFIGDYLYRLSGKSLSDPVGDDHYVNVYKIPTSGTVTGDAALQYRVLVNDMGELPDGTNETSDNFSEPEGISVYKAPDGRVSLYLSKVTGVSLGRQYKVYGWTEGMELPQGPTLAALTDYFPTELNGQARYPGALTSMTELKRAGWYYLTASQMTGRVATDRPSGFGSGGGLLFVSPQNDPAAADPSYVQTLYTFGTTTVVPKMYIRTIFESGAKSQWSLLTGTPQGYAGV